MAKLFVASTRAELDGGLDTVEKAVLRVKELLAVVRQAIRLASSYGPEDYVFRIESKDKEIPSSPPTLHQNEHHSSNDTTKTQNDKRSANDVTPRHQQWSLTANVAEGGDKKNHFANGPNTLRQTTARRVLRTHMLVLTFGAWSGQKSS
jgi:hypothetical protein